MKNFEYKVLEAKSKMGFTDISLDTEELTLQLNRLGAEGWELITTSPITLNGSSFRIYFTLRRPI